MISAPTKSCVLDKETTKRKLRRMALEVAEQNADETELIIAAINGNGEVVAKKIEEELRDVSALYLRIISIVLDKKDPVKVFIEPKTDLENKVILIVDDVANTGKTMMYALKPFLGVHTKKIQTLVLVERSHKLFPIQTDYTGLSIATTLQEHILVETDKNEITGAWLH